MEAKDLLTLVLGRWEFFLKLWDFYKVVSLALLAFVASFVRDSTVAIIAISVVFIGFAVSHLYGLITTRNQWEALAKATKHKLGLEFSNSEMKDNMENIGNILQAPHQNYVIIFHLILDLVVLGAIAVIHKPELLNFSK